jgi:hypothetical protein
VDVPVKEHFTADEAVAAFGALSKEERRNLIVIARACLAGTGFATPDELISEAYIRIAEGKRRWNKSKTFTRFLAGVFRSLATDADFLPEERNLVRRNEGSTIVTSDQLDNVSVVEDGDLSQKFRDDEALTKLETRFSGDEEMELLLMGVREGLIGNDLQEAIGVDAKRLEALRTRLNRELKKLAAEYGMTKGKS